MIIPTLTCNSRYFTQKLSSSSFVCVPFAFDNIAFGTVSLYVHPTKPQLRLFPFRRRLLPFLTVDATISNQAFSDGKWNTFPGLNCNKANK